MPHTPSHSNVKITEFSNELERNILSIANADVQLQTAQNNIRSNLLFLFSK